MLIEAVIALDHAKHTSTHVIMSSCIGHSVIFLYPTEATYIKWFLCCV